MADDAVITSLKTAIAQLKSDQETQMASLIQELNTVRNSIPAATAKQATQAVRVFRNFREFRDTIERKPIRIERNS